MLCASSAWAYTRIVDVSIKQPKLLAALRVVARAAKGATSLMPVQSHVLIRAELDEGGTSLSASSGVVALRADVEMDIAEPGAVCVPATELLNIVKELNSDASVRICTEPLSHSEARSHAEARKVRLLSGTLVHRLNGLASRVFPKEADATSVQWAVFDAEALVSALAKCLPHVGRDESRVALTGVCIERAADRVVMVATDGHRLKVTNCRTTFEGVESKVGDQWLAPRQGLAELMSVLKVAKNVE
ncbi:MAG: DNA polymerase III subunit beta, partial [Myxococcota bacterium]